MVEFKPPFSNGMNASVAIGKSDLVTKAAHEPKTNLIAPDDMNFDPPGNLWTEDDGNGTFVQFQPPFSTGMAASTIIDQFHSGIGEGGHPTFDSSGNLWYVDGFADNRILEFTATPVPEFPISCFA